MKIIPVKFKVISIIALLLFIFSLGLNFSNYTVSKNFISQKIINNDLQTLSNNIKNEIESQILPNINLVTAMSNNYFIKKWFNQKEKDIEGIKKYFKNIEDNYKVFVASMTSKSTNLQYTKAGIFTKLTKTNPFNQWFYSFLDRNEDLELNITVDELRNFKLVAFINHILKNEKGKQLGCVTLGLDLESIQSLILKYITPTRNIYLVNKKGYIIVHKDKNLIYTLKNEQENKIRNIKYRYGIDKISKNILSSTDKIVDKYINKDNEEKILVSSYIPSINSYLIVEEDENVLFKEISSLLMYKFIVSMFATVILLLLIMFILNTMVFKKLKQDEDLAK